MVIDGKSLKIVPYRDFRGHSGESGQLYITDDQEGNKYLMKTKPIDVANEFVAHNIAKLIGVPTSDAVLIKSEDKITVGIKYESDFKRVSLDDFIGARRTEGSGIRVFDGINNKWLEPSEQKIDMMYPDDSPYLADIMRYLVFRRLIVLEDNPQLAFAGGRIISFDYAESFFMNESSFSSLMHESMLSQSVSLFKERVFLEGGYPSSIDLLHREDSDFLVDAYMEPLENFLVSDFRPIFDDLNVVFPSAVSAFYEACIAYIGEKISKFFE